MERRSSRNRIDTVMRLKDKRILVTGASRGIGRAIALELARHETELVLHYGSDESQAQAVLADVIRLGSRGHLLQADMRYPINAVNLGKSAWALCGELDVLINNAGVSYKRHFLDQTEADVDYFYNVNYKSPLLLTQQVARNMVESKIAGSIYSITSVNAIRPGVGQSAYGASKAALETLMKGVAHELAPDGIRVNTFVIGAIQTDMNAKVWEDPTSLQSVNEYIPLRRLGRPEEVARLLCNVLQADSYLTGSSITLDGGWLLPSGFVRAERRRRGRPATE